MYAVLEKGFVAALFAGLLFGAAAMAAEAPATLPGGLERVPNAKVGLAYLRPGTVWSKYKTIQLRALSVPAKVRDATPKGERPGFGESYVLRDKDVSDLQDAYMQVTRDVLSHAGYTFVDTPQADTLIVAVQVTNITLAAPIESTRATYTSRGATISQGGGSLAIAAVLADGATGQIVAEAADRKYPSDLWRKNDRISNMVDVKQAFGSWARALRDRLAG